MQRKENAVNNIIPRVAAIHDISGLGRCSLTVLMPVLSTLGIQVCPVPTAVLSTQTGGFTDFFFHDTSDCIQGISKHWEDLGIAFDCIYSGFLGSAMQIDLVADFINCFGRKRETLIVVDPVMGDNGILYSTYTKELQNKMHCLVEMADIITPNPTEVSFLLGECYSDEPVNASEIKRRLRKLTDIGPNIAVITGIKTEDGSYANVGLNHDQGSFWRVSYRQYPKHYPGTGDIFTSVLTGSLLKGNDLPDAMEMATRFISLAIRITYGCGTPEREGVLIEKVLGYLQNDLLFNNYDNPDISIGGM